MILIRTIERKDFYINYYKSLNFVLNLSNKELAILSYFSSIRANLPRDNSSLEQIFNSDNRKLVAQSLGISIFNLNNYIKSLRVKGILEYTNKKLNINHRIWIDINNIEDKYTNEFRFNII